MRAYDYVGVDAEVDGEDGAEVVGHGGECLAKRLVSSEEVEVADEGESAGEERREGRGRPPPQPP